MDDLTESLSSLDNEGIFYLDDPEKIDDLKGLSDRITINILQILNSKIADRKDNSWWSISAIRQLTFIDRTSAVKKILKSFVQLGIIDVLKISKLPGYSINKKGVHGLISQTDNLKHRKKYKKDGFCYKLRVEAIDLIFRDSGLRYLYIPLENLHLDNLQLLNLLFRRRTMIILRSFVHEGPMKKDDFTNYLNSYYERTDEEDHVLNYDLSSLYKLAKQYFHDNLSNQIYSDPPLDNKEWFIIKRDLLTLDTQKTQKNNSIFYTLNFDRIRFLFSNQMGERFKDPNRSIQIHYPGLESIYKPSKHKEIVINDVTINGIVIDIQ